MNDETLVVVDEATGVDDAVVAAVMDAPVRWTRANLVATLDVELSTVLGTSPAVWDGPTPLKPLPTIDRALELRDAALDMLNAGDHEGPCMQNARGACIHHVRSHRLRAARLSRALGREGGCTFCRGSKLVTNLPSAEAWSEWTAWVKSLEAPPVEGEERPDDHAEVLAFSRGVRAVPCPVCSGDAG